MEEKCKEKGKVKFHIKLSMSGFYFKFKLNKKINAF